MKLKMILHLLQLIEEKASNCKLDRLIKCTHEHTIEYRENMKNQDGAAIKQLR